MKASVKFRDDQKPLFRAKIPLSILGLPFQSGIVAGESKELTLNLGTFFESGPSIRIAYRPNDTWNPFSLIVKTGSGAFGSPISSSMLMSAEFNLLGRGNPRFMLHFKPRFGDFSVKKSHSSVFDSLVKPQNGVASQENDDVSSVDAVESPIMSGSFSGKKITVPSVCSVAGILSSMEVTANTSMPVRSRAVVNLRWGVRFPSEIKSSGEYINPTAGISFQKIPFLVMNKIGIEHVEGPVPTTSTSKTLPNSTSGLPATADLAEACFLVKRQLEVLHAENGLLKKAVEDLRRDFAGGGRSLSAAAASSPAGNFEFDRTGGKNPSGKSKTDRRNNEKKASADLNGFSTSEGDVSGELKKALKGASGA